MSQPKTSALGRVSKRSVRTRDDHPEKAKLLEMVVADLEPNRAEQLFEEVDIQCLKPGRHQPRHHFDMAELELLSESIRTMGIVQPLIVSPVEAGQYEILAGERRWRAAQIAGLSKVPVLIRTVDEQRAALIALVENLQRKDLDPIEEARGLQRLIDQFSISQSDIARQLGRSRSAVSRSLGLLSLPEEVQACAQRGSLNAGHIKALIGLSSDMQCLLAHRAEVHRWSVREMERARARCLQKASSKEIQDNDPDIHQLEQQLSDHLLTRVQVKRNRKGGGSLVIHFSDVETCDGILHRIGYKKPEDE